MISILVDHNVEGQAALLLGTLVSEGWMALGLFRIVRFTDMGLPFNSTDRVMWQFAQDQKMLLLTSNRNMDGEHSLEQTICVENRPTSLPVITISDVGCVIEKPYREQCATRLAEIALYLDSFLGAGRIYIP